MLTENWERGIWIENTIFAVWLFIGVIIFSLLLAMIYGKSTESKNSWKGKGAIYNPKEIMTLIFLSICRFYVYCPINHHTAKMVFSIQIPLSQFSVNILSFIN
jgi:hypothetical protein